MQAVVRKLSLTMIHALWTRSSGSARKRVGTRTSVVAHQPEQVLVRMVDDEVKAQGLQHNLFERQQPLACLDKVEGRGRQALGQLGNVLVEADGERRVHYVAHLARMLLDLARCKHADGTHVLRWELGKGLADVEPVHEDLCGGNGQLRAAGGARKGVYSLRAMPIFWIVVAAWKRLSSSLAGVDFLATSRASYSAAVRIHCDSPMRPGWLAVMG